MQEYIYDITDNVVEVDSDYIENIEEKIKNKEELQETEINYYLSSLLYKLKLHLNKITKDDSYKGLCSYAQCALHYTLEKLGVKHYMHRTLKTIDEGCTDHYFLIAEFDVMGQVKSYILDPTYKQFFVSETCYKNNDIVRVPGKYYLAHPEYKEHVLELLQNGYILITDDVIKMYGDSFYYSKIMPDGFDSELPLYVYKKLLRKEDGVIAKEEDYLYSLGLLPIINANEKRL